MADRSPTLGFIGLGAMGGRMASNLLGAGYRLIGYDIRPEALEACIQAGGEPANGPADVVARADVVITCLVGPVYVRVAEADLIPGARGGQLFLDHSTVPAPRTRRIAAALADRGATVVDAPVSGGITSAAAGTLRVFVGGPDEAVQRCRPILAVVGDPQQTFHAGPAGMGQVQKVVQQLTHRLTDAARLEVLAFAVRCGLDLTQALAVIGEDPDGDGGYAKLVRCIQSGGGDELHCLFSEWGYYLNEARQRGTPMPILESLHAFCDTGLRVGRDEQGREVVSVWHELTTREGPALGG